MPEWIWPVLVLVVGGVAAIKLGRLRATSLRKVGSKSPGFALLNQHGEMKHAGLLDGIWHVLYFYPRDDTPGCTLEACGFRDAWDELKEMGVRVFGVSYDDEASHLAFAEKYELPFDLLANPTGRVVKEWGAKAPVPGIALRVSYLIDGDGMIRKVYPKVSDAAAHAAEIIADVRALRGDAPSAMLEDDPELSREVES
ncbi:MAG: peroxiredoxin [Leptospirillia bacterium]